MSEKVGSALVPVGPPSRHYPTPAEVIEYAKAFFESKLYKLDNLAQARVRIQTGIDMGMTPTEAVRNVVVVNGVPSFSAQFIAARLKASRPRYDYRVLKLDARGCELEFWQDGKPSGKFSFTEEDAKAAGLIPAKPDSPWTKYRRNMMFSRAVTAGQRIYAPDVLGAGVAAYTPEELGGKPAPEDIPDAEFEVVED